jgi:ABC-type multidrug transport system fused ATPase/permease subunit
MLAAARKLLAILSGKERTQLYLLAVAMVGMAFVQTAGVASIMPFMAVVANPDVIQTNKWLKLAYDSLEFSNVRDFLFLLGMLVLGFLVFTNLFKALTEWWTLKFNNGLYYMLARRLLARYMARPYAFFLNRNTADMGKNVLSEVRVVVVGVIDSGLKFLANALVCLFIVVLLLVIDPLIAVMILAVLGGAYAAIYRLARSRLATISREQVFADSMKFKIAGEALGGIKDLKILGGEPVFLARFAEHAQRHALNNVAHGVISRLPRYALEIISFGGILLIVLYFLEADAGFGTMAPLLALYAYAGYRLLPALQEVYAGVTTMRANLYGLEVLHRDMTEEGGKADSEAALAASRGLQPLPFARELELRDVRFSYSGAENPVLDGISLVIPCYSSVGIVGATGTGKTTLVDLILGLLTATSGQIRVDGVEIGGENLLRWRRNVGYVPQNIFLTDDTITNNIAFGAPEQEIDQAAVVRAARIANLQEFIESELPRGYQTVIGERGVRLSGGQRQRLGIARALYRDPAMLIMDEATSSLDGVTEGAVNEALHALSGKKTVITIAHRLTTVKACDVIYLMEQGRIVSHGTYDELLKTSSWFRAAARTGA